MKQALKWFAEHNGDGMFGKNGWQTLAAGENAPFMRGTFNKLIELGYLEKYETRRIRITAAGNIAVESF